MEPLQFTDEEFRRIQRELDAGRVPQDKFVISDPETPGLVRILRAGGYGYFVIRYKIIIDDKPIRPHCSLESLSDLSIASARLIARLFHALAAVNVDPWSFIDNSPMKQSSDEASQTLEQLIDQFPDTVLPFPPRK